MKTTENGQISVQLVMWGPPSVREAQREHRALNHPAAPS